MRASRMFAAIAAALVAALLSLGGASLVAAGQPEGNGNGNNGNAYGHSDESAPPPAQAAPVESGGGQKKAPATSRANSRKAKSRTQTAPSAPKTQGGGSQSTATSGPGNSSQGCDGTHHSDTGHGANQGGPYDNTCDGSPSGNGNGNGQATGKPCAGCVGNADDKNPKGQMPNGSDHNAGYECDRNHGIGRTNPAHTGCKTTTVTPPPTGCANPPCNPGGGNPGGGNPGGGNPGGGNPGGGNPGGGNPTPPGQQTVLGTTQTGSAPAPAAPQSTPAPRSEVLGESEEGSAPASSPAPAETAPTSALRTRAAPASGKLPFTGGDAVIVLLAGCMMLLTGFGLQRLLTRS